MIDIESKFLTDGTTFKLCGLVTILLITLVSGIAPIRLVDVDEEKRDRILSFFSFFTGGVFLGAGLLHMLPDAQEQLSNEKFPFVFLASIAGFIVVWSIDKVNITANDGEKKTLTHKREIMAVAASASDGGAVICSVSIPSKTTYRKSSDVNPSDIIDNLSPNYNTFQTNEIVDIHGYHSPTLKQRTLRKTSTTTCFNDTAYNHEEETYAEVEEDQLVRRRNSSITHKEHHNHGHNHGHTGDMHDHEHDQGHHHHIVIPGDDVLLPFILALVFSVHSFVAGLALGVQNSVNGSAVSILVAILSHKVVEAITVGTNFVKEKVPIKRAIPVILVYCFMTPMGILVGMYLTDIIASKHSVAFQAFAQAFASGSFIYLAMHEISDEKCCHSVQGWQQVLLLISGVAVMAVIAIWV